MKISNETLNDLSNGIFKFDYWSLFLIYSSQLSNLIILTREKEFIDLLVHFNSPLKKKHKKRSDVKFYLLC